MQGNANLYPQRLLPKPTFKIIKHEDLNDYYLIRYTNTKSFLDEDTKFLKTSEISSSHMSDLSTNLLGKFEVEDIYIEYLKGSDSSSYFSSDWIEKTEVGIVPIWEKDFSICLDRGFFLLKISEINGHPVPYCKGNDKFQAFCRIIHTPTNSNFWHCSIRWFDEEGQDIYYQKGSFRNRLNSSTRAVLCEFIKCQVPDAIPIIDESVYT